MANANFRTKNKTVISILSVGTINMSRNAAVSTMPSIWAGMTKSLTLSVLQAKSPIHVCFKRIFTAHKNLRKCKILQN